MASDLFDRKRTAAALQHTASAFAQIQRQIAAQHRTEAELKGAKAIQNGAGLRALFPGLKAKT